MICDIDSLKGITGEAKQKLQEKRLWLPGTSFWEYQE